MGIWKRAKPFVETAEHLHFGDMVFQALFDWRTLLAGAGGGVVTIFTAAYDGRSVTDVLLAGAIGVAVFVVLGAALLFLWRVRKSTPQVAVGGSSKQAAIQELAPDIDAKAAFFEILENSVWREHELSTTTDTKHLVRNWLEVRLDCEIHRALRNSRLAAWGEESLPGTATTPEKPIPPETWDKVEVAFDRNSFLRTAAYFKGPTSLQLGPMAWVGVKFSKDQIFGLFPLKGVHSIDRIPCTELLKIATAAGWDFSSQNSLHLIDLQEAMRQGGADDTLTIWGKANKWTSEQLMRSELLDKISPDHWKEFFVHLYAATQDDNFNTYSWTPEGKDFGRKGYVDLHVDRSQATSWLRRDASSFKGKRKPR